MAPMPITDAVFLMAERREQPMHVGGLQLFEFPPDVAPDWLLVQYERMINGGEVAPLFRRRAHRPPSSMGAWSWQVDHDVDLEHHIRLSALPQPGRVRELLALCSRLHGSLLDRHRPLWEAHLIEGLEGNRFGLYTKIHHALVDGVSALRLLQHSLSSDPDDRDSPMPWAWQPEHRQSASGARGLRSLTGASRAALKTTTEIAGLGPIAGRAAIRSLAAQSSYLPSSAPKTILNTEITGARRFAAQSWPFDKVRAVAKACDGTINDVILAMCSSALRKYLHSLDALPEEPLIAMTPVSLRQAGAEIGGNAVGALLCNLATNLDDPAERLAAIRLSMNEGKKSLRSMTPTQVTLASALAMTPMLLGMVPGARRLAPLPYNVVISNVPGPQEALFWNGARLEGVYPLSIPMDGQALNITIASYNGSLDFGLIGCRRTVPHLQRMLTFLDEGLEELAAVTAG
jgi:diacylglycerol O-acyltransferase / wax synthase